MKLSFRRYKKACKKKAEGRKLRPSDVYVIREGTYRIERNKVQAQRMVLTALTSAIGAVQIAMITSRPTSRLLHPAAAIVEKAFAAVEVVKNSAEAMKKIFEQNPDPAREWLKKILNEQPNA